VPSPELPDRAALAQLVATAADLCRKPLRHAVVDRSDRQESGDDRCLTLEVRDSAGERLPDDDLELELYSSSGELNLTLAWLAAPERPMLWHGQHPVWMDASGRRCERPQDGLPLEALGRRLRALLV
jgi:hypothetical protein